MEEFYNIFGPELKAVTGDPKRIDDVLCRVDSLVTPMESLNFDPFSIKSSPYWKYVMDDFKLEVLASDTAIDSTTEAEARPLVCSRLPSPFKDLFISMCMCAYVCVRAHVRVYVCACVCVLLQRPEEAKHLSCSAMPHIFL